MEKHFSLNCEAPRRGLQMCPHCADGADPDLARRKRVLQVLALIEHPTALPPDAALRIAQELLAWTGPGSSGYRGDQEVAVEAPMEAVV